MYFLLGIFTWAKDAIGEFIMGSFRGLVFDLTKFIYKFIAFTYDVFEILCNGRLLSNSAISDLFKRIALILSLVMVARVAFTFIQLLLDPDSITDTKKGIPNVIKKVVIVIVMLGTSTYVFSLLSNIQTAIISNNTIPKLLLPQTIKTEYTDANGETHPLSFGSRLSGEIFLAFWQKRTRSDESYGTTGLCDADYLDNAELAIKVESNFEFAEQCVNAIGEIDDSDSSLSGNIETKKAYIIDFNWFMAIIVGLVTLWLLLSYCLNAGIRIVQLTLLQILSPVAIIGYLSPKDETTFTKWLKIYFSTYIDVFIRLAILNFIAYIMALIFEDSDGVFWHSLGLDTSNDLAVKGFITVIICLALLSFAKKAPELLQKIFPTGESGLNLGFEKASSFAPAGMAAGIGLSTLGTSAVEAASRFKTQLKEHPEKGLRSAFAASLGGLGSGMRHGFVDGFKKGNPLKNSYNAWKAGQARGNQYHELVKNGGSAWGQTKERLKDIAGQSTGALDDELVERSEQVEKSLSGLLDNAKGTSGYKMFDERIKTASLNNQWDLVSKLQDAQDQYLQDFVEKSLKGEITKDSKLSYDITATEAVTYDKDVFDENGTLVHGKGENILDKNGNVQYRTVSQTVSTVTTGGDLIKSGSIQSGYAEIKEYVDQVKPKTMDSNGNISQTAITLPAAKDANMGTIKGTIGQAQTTIQNVKGRSGYRAGQANKPNNKNN